MPQVVPLIISGLGAAGVIGTTAAAWLTIASSIAVGIYEQERAKSKARDARNAYNESLQDRILTVRSAVSPREYVLGTVRKGGTLLYADTVGTDKTSLDSVTALCCNETEVVGYYIGDEYLTPQTFPGDKFGSQEQQSIKDQFNTTSTGASAHIQVTLSFIPSGTVDAFYTHAAARGIKQRATVVSVVGTTLTVTGVGVNGNCQIFAEYNASSGVKLKLQFKNGTPDQETENWQLVDTPLWTAEHRLRGVTHIRTLMVWDETIYASGAPPISAVLKGHAIAGYSFYDPRTGTNPDYTDNPALLAAWYMTLPRVRGGCGIPSSWIDWTWVSAAANVCDELIQVRGLYPGDPTELIKRYQCHTVISTARDPLQNLQQILSAMNGRYVFSAGVYRIVAGAFRAATRTLTIDDIVGDEELQVITVGGDDDPPNIVTAQFADAAKNWAETSPPAVRNDSYIELDDAEVSLDLKLPATTDARQANYLQGVMLESKRPAFGLSVPVGGIGEDIAVFDCVQISLPDRPAYAGKTYEVLNTLDKWNGRFRLTLAEIRPQTWALDANRFTPRDPIVPPDLSYLWNVPEITGLAVELGEPQILPDGNAITQVTLTWDAVTALYIGSGGRIEIRYAEAGGEWIAVAPVPGDSTGTTITASLVEESNYVFQVRLVNSIGAPARVWSQAWVTVEGTELAVGVAGPGIFTWANPVNVSTTSSSITKTGGTAAYNAGAHSLQSYSGGCFVSARCGQIGTRRVIGLNGDPAVDAGNLGIDFSFATTQANVLQIYESGLLISSHGAVTAETLVTVKYNNSDIVYEKDGTPVRTTTIGANRRFFLDCSLYEVGATLVDIAFGPMGGIGPQGIAGANAQAVRLSGSAQAFTYDASGSASPAGQSITFSAIRQNIATAATWTAVANDGATVTLTGSGDSRALSITNFGTKSWVRVRAEASGFFDEITVVKLTQGANGVNSIQAILTNEAHAIAANPDGVVPNPGQANGRMYVYEGTTDRTALATFSVLFQNGCTGIINTADNTPIAAQPRGYYRLSTITSDSATLTLRAVYGSVTIDKVFSVTRTREGQPGDGQNLLKPEQWVVGTTGNQGSEWTAFGPAVNSGIYLGGASASVPLGPFGTSDVVWECRRLDASEANSHGGWSTPVNGIDATKTYRSAMWVRINEQTGFFYHDLTNSVGNYAALTPVDGGATPGRYNDGSRPPENGKWFLSIAIAHGNGYTGGNSGVSGLYDPATGRKVILYSEYRWVSGVTATRQYAFLWQAPTSTRLMLTRPRFEEVNGSEPSIDSLLGFQRSTPWIETGNCYASTTSFYKVGGTNVWGQDAIRSALSYRTFHLQFKPGSLGTYCMVGANSDPAADANYASIDYAIYPAAGSLQIYESDMYIGDFGSYTLDTECAITGDGAQIRYYKDRAQIRITGAPAVPYGLDSAFYSPGAQVNNVRFGPGIELESISTGELAPGAVGEQFYSSAGTVTTPSTQGNHLVHSFVVTPTQSGLLWVAMDGNIRGNPVPDAFGNVTVGQFTVQGFNGATSSGSGGSVSSSAVLPISKTFAIPVTAGQPCTIYLYAQTFNNGVAITVSGLEFRCRNYKR